MGDSGAPTPKRMQIDALVLACANSRLKDVVGTDALRSVLDVEYRDLTAEGVFDLQTIWELFEQQPGFDPDAAASPLARFKSWEKRFGLEVKLPAAMRNLSDAELSIRASECEIATPDLQKLFRGTKDPDEEDAKKKKKTTKLVVEDQSSTKTPPAADSMLTPSRRRALEIGLGVIGVVAIGFAGMTVYGECNKKAKWTGISDDFGGDLPITSTQRIGNQVSATLTDSGWRSLPVEEREQQLGDALRNLADRDIAVLFLKTDTGKVVATAQFKPGTDDIQFTFK
jgi:hypothetical protein